MVFMMRSSQYESSKRQYRGLLKYCPVLKAVQGGFSFKYFLTISEFYMISGLDFSGGIREAGFVFRFFCSYKKHSIIPTEST